MRIVWHGHSCFEIEGGEATIVLDPHDGRALGIKPPSASASTVLMSHNHYDHSASRVIRGMHEDIMERNGIFTSSGVEIEGFPTFHDVEKGGKFGTNTMYRFLMDGVSVCHCGDIGAMPSADVISKIKGTDVMMIPAGEVNTMDMSLLEHMMDAISPKVVIPMHYHVCGLSIPLRNLDRFMNMAGDCVDYVGLEIDISKEELPSKREYWVFSR